MSTQHSPKNMQLAGKIRFIRESKGFSAAYLAEMMGVTAKYFAAVERGDRKPSQMFLRFFCALLQEPVSPMLELAGIKPSPSFDYDKFYKAAGSFIIGLSFATPAFPVAASSLLAGTGAATLIARLTQAFNAKNDKQLAEKYLGVDASTLSNWRARDKVPEKYIRQAAAETGKSLEWFLSSDQKTDLSLLAELIDVFETRQIQQKKEIPSKKKSEIICMLYLRAMNRGEVDEDEVEVAVLAAS